MNKVSASTFYTTWIDVVTRRRDRLLTVWRNAHVFTHIIKGASDSVICEVADILELACYNQDYYSLDAILYQQDDLVKGLTPHQHWFRNIRVAFEHENHFRSGLYKEVSHLVLTNCDLRVLVTYPEDDIEAVLAQLHEIISGNRMAHVIAEEKSFLLIFGYENGFEWKGYVYTLATWQEI
jgi:hypothetical protein